MIGGGVMGTGIWRAGEQGLLACYTIEGKELINYFDSRNEKRKSFLGPKKLWLPALALLDSKLPT
jgi:hypothetical protein